MHLQEAVCPNGSGFKRSAQCMHPMQAAQTKPNQAMPKLKTLTFPELKLLALFHGKGMSAGSASRPTLLGRFSAYAWQGGKTRAEGTDGSCIC